MMTVIVDPGWLLDRGLWARACDELGINEWAINEGLMERDHRLTLTYDQAVRIGVLVTPDPWSAA